MDQQIRTTISIRRKEMSDADADFRLNRISPESGITVGEVRLQNWKAQLQQSTVLYGANRSDENLSSVTQSYDDAYYSSHELYLIANRIPVPSWFQQNLQNTLDDIKKIQNFQFTNIRIFQENLSDYGFTATAANGHLTILSNFPGICVGSAQDIYTKCFNTTLLECQQCGIIRGAIFLFVVVCLGLAILIGNGLTVLVGIRRCRRGKESKMDICRTSLAMADILASVQLMFVIFNFSWSMNMTPLELDRKQLSLLGSPLAITAGILIVFGLTSSMYHLAFMALERFYAIALPFKYKWQRKRSVYFGIAIIWMLTATGSSLSTNLV
ncbi:unnamed protein product [Clavelina lepadiformis]|uniref:G-protein coupled receptors family 1 profile domain-containing protein n=1 Tax=Clavelina lepadiformis TaxID=159417 RepID=A0ABP0GU11_CLALP